MCYPFLVRWLWLQCRMALLAVVIVLFGMCVLALAAVEVGDGRIGLGIWFIVLFLLNVACGYYGWDKPSE